MENETSYTPEQIADALQLLGLFSGPQKPFVTFLTGNAGLVTSLGDLIDKINNGTATRNDYIDVVKDIGSTVAGVALMTELVGVTLLEAPVILGIGVGLAVLDYIDSRNYDPDEMMKDIISIKDSISDWMTKSGLFGSNKDYDDLENILDSLANPKPIQITLSDTTANEKEGTITFTANINQPLDHDFTFKVSTIDGSATGNVDYMSVPNGTITIKAGETEAKYAIQIASDGAYEISEEFMLYAHYEKGTYTGYDLGKVTGATATGTITDELFEGACPTAVTLNFGFNFDVPTPIVSASYFFTCKTFTISKALHVKTNTKPKEANNGLYQEVA
ncbi:MAG: Calx-beta domain-containing protein [Sulfurospirillaceae bacterium]|nr:Calx-beta domain-containing protein [Sulfurospirillaceae bacterium]